MKIRSLKIGEFSSPSVKVNFERYVIETKEDLDDYTKSFPEIKKFNVYNSMLGCISKGLVVLATDRHPLSSFPTWCIENTDSNHPSAIKRVKLL